ncbi:MAG: non-hydrolyzing UDP-N-acetylglucosamine 2-epimerase [Ignavibacteriales bacterium]
MIKVMTVFGTRPEAIKMAPLVNELAKRSEIKNIVCVTAQHRQMLDQVLQAFNISPDYDLDIMQDKQTLAGITTRALEGLYDVMQKEKPELVFVQGDTTTAFVGALAAFYNKIKVGHVEAGLRTFDKYSPYPEEMNRKLAGVLTDYHFAPTMTSKENLLNEGVDNKYIYVTGNTVIDALKTTVNKNYKFEDETLKGIDFKKRIILVTAHRRENWGKPLAQICTALKNLAENYKDIEIIYPVHLNPIVQETAREILGSIPNVHLINPLEVLEIHNLMDRCYMVLTDSGGLQEEAPSLGKPVIVLRTETERPEAAVAGTVKVAGTDRDKIYNLAAELLDNPEEYNKMARAVNPYGDGNASSRIVQAVLYEFGISEQKPDEFIIQHK